MVPSPSREPADDTGMPAAFLFTDIEGSTLLWDEQPAAMRVALARHDEILRQVIEDAGGTVFKTTGDGLHAVFESSRDAADRDGARPATPGRGAVGHHGTAARPNGDRRGCDRRARR